MIDPTLLPHLRKVFKGLEAGGLLTGTLFANILDTAYFRTLHPDQPFRPLNKGRALQGLMRYWRSQAAQSLIADGVPGKVLTKEHVVPNGVLFAIYEGRDRYYSGPDRLGVVARLYEVAFITLEQNLALNEAGLRSKMPSGWSVPGNLLPGENAVAWEELTWRRYHVANLLSGMCPPAP